MTNGLIVTLILCTLSVLSLFGKIDINVRTKYTVIIVFRSTYLSAENRGKRTSYVLQVSKKVIGQLSGNRGAS